MPADRRGAEERAEEIVEQLVSEGSRWFSRAFGRAREEIEDILAEGRDLYRHGRDDAAGAEGAAAPPSPTT